MPSAAMHLLFLVEKQTKADPLLRSAVTRRVSRLDSASLRSVELVHIMGSRTAVKARDDIVGGLLINLLRSAPAGLRYDRTL